MVNNSKKLFSSVSALVLTLHVCVSSPVLAMDENKSAPSSVSLSSPSSSSDATDSSFSSSSATQSSESQVQQEVVVQQAVVQQQEQPHKRYIPRVVPKRESRTQLAARQQAEEAARRQAALSQLAQRPQNQAPTQPQRMVVLRKGPQPTGGTTHGQQQPITGSLSDRARAFDNFARSLNSAPQAPKPPSKWGDLAQRQTNEVMLSGGRRNLASVPVY